ncbi:MAG: flagellar hook-associated protein FlgK [Lachnospiraceae bacterium]|nr:flagellar hook-associated protein FlgK [Lachnospiraceae bacterium]
MPSQFFGLTIAGSGLRAANASLNTTNNNIANASSTGYSRQTVVQEAQTPLRTFVKYGCAGAGVDVIAIERNRSEFYDAKYRTNMTKLGVYEVKEYYQMQVQQYLKDDGKTGFSTLFGDIANKLQSIITNGANSNPVKQDFISSASGMAEYFNTMAGDLTEIQKDINDEIKLTVDSINSIASSIATLNQQINVIEMTGTTANVLRDKRDNLVDQLSELVQVETSESPLMDPNDPERATGGTRFLVKIAGGQTLVDSQVYQQLECTTREARLNQSDADGLYELQWTNGNVFTMTNPSIGGKLQGLIEMRDGNNSFYFHGKVLEVAPDAGNTHKLVMQPGDENLLDLNKASLPASGVLDVGSRSYVYDSWTFDEASGTYTFVINDNKSDSTIGGNVVGQTAQIGNAYDYQGIPYYMQQMNEWLRCFSQSFNKILQEGFTSSGEKGTWLFTAGDPSGKHDPENGLIYGQYALNLQGDKIDKAAYYQITAYNFQIKKELVDDPSLLATKSEATLGVDAYDVITKLTHLLKDESYFSFRGGSAGEFLDSLLSDVALNASSAETFTTTYEAIKKNIANQKLSVMGVDQEEEGIHLVQYQNDYNLASKMIQVLSEVYDRLIKETGV